MRIALFCPTVSGAGGMESATLNLLSGFRELGDETHLFVFGGSYDARWLQGVEHTVISSPSDPRLIRIAKYAAGAAGAVASWKPDIIICADGTTLQMARLGRSLARRARTRIASWIHFPLPEIRLKEKLHKADLHLAITRQTEEDLKAFLPQQRDRVYTILNAVASGPAALVPRPRNAVFLYTGRLNFDGHKRVNDILVAAAKLRGDWQLSIVGAAPRGDEDQEQRLHRLAEELAIAPRITWLGWQQDPWAAAGPVTALLSSSSREAFGMVLVEACSHGIACISSACSGPVEIIREGENGWLYPVGDTDQLAQRMQQILDNPSILPSQQAVQSSIERFSAKAVAQRARDGIAEAMAAAR